MAGTAAEGAGPRLGGYCLFRSLGRRSWWKDSALRASKMVSQTAGSVTHTENCCAAPGEKAAVLSHQGTREYATV